MRRGIGIKLRLSSLPGVVGWHCVRMKGGWQVTHKMQADEMSLMMQM